MCLLLLAASCNCIADAVDVTLNFFRVGLLRCECPAGLEQSVPVCCGCECLQCAQTHATGAALDHYRYHHYYQIGKAKMVMRGLLSEPLALACGAAAHEHLPLVRADFCDLMLHAPRVSRSAARSTHANTRHIHNCSHQ